MFLLEIPNDETANGLAVGPQRPKTTVYKLIENSRYLPNYPKIFRQCLGKFSQCVWSSLMVTHEIHSIKEFPLGPCCSSTAKLRL